MTEPRTNPAMQIYQVLLDMGVREEDLSASHFLKVMRELEAPAGRKSAGAYNAPLDEPAPSDAIRDMLMRAEGPLRHDD